MSQNKNLISTFLFCVCFHFLNGFFDLFFWFFFNSTVFFMLYCYIRRLIFIFKFFFCFSFGCNFLSVLISHFYLCVTVFRQYPKNLKTKSRNFCPVRFIQSKSAKTWCFLNRLLLLLILKTH